MQLILALIIGLILVFIFWFIGHLIRKIFNFDFSEENQLLKELINIGLGASAFLIVINLIGSIVRDFNIALIVTLAIIIGIGFWQKEETLKVVSLVKEYSNQDKLKGFFKQHTDKYFWILIGVINFIYASTAFSSLKWDRAGLGNAHIYNIDHLVAGDFPPKYSFLPNIAQKYHYGSDILGAVISKISTCHAEISLDLLLLIFLNLSILAIYALTVKYQNTNPINKYLVPFAVFLAWGPITNLFSKNPGENIPQKFIEQIAYLTQTRLIDSANWSGLTLNWFFAPPIGLGTFFFLIAIYLLFRFFEGEKNIKCSILLGAFLSSFVIIDFTKFVILIFGVFLYLFLSPIPLFDNAEEEDKETWKTLLKNLGIILGIAIILGFIHGNWLRVGKDYQSLITYFNLGTSSIDKNFGPLNTNLVLLAIYGLGFYQAHKLKQNWVFFTLPFFLASYMISFFVSVPNAGVGKIMMTGNLIAAFSFPLAVEFLRKEADKQFKFDEKKIKYFYGIIFFIFSFSTLMYWGFGDREKPLFRYSNEKLAYSGAQELPRIEVPTPNPQSEEYPFVQYLKSHGANGQGIVIESKYDSIFSSLAGTASLFRIRDDFKNFNAPLNNNVAFEKNYSFYENTYYPFVYTLDKEYLSSQNIHWLYLSPRLFKFSLNPISRMKLLNTFSNEGLKLSVSNNKDDMTVLNELYQINPEKFDSFDFPDLNKLQEKLKKNSNSYLKYISECPYLAVYSSNSNDFNGDGIADIAFYNNRDRKWIILDGKEQTEKQIDLNKTIFANYVGMDLFIPIPGDYDGDLKTDIALFNRNNGEWKVLSSKNNTVDFLGRFGGAINEIPMPADCDGNGITDRIVYSQYATESDATWPGSKMDKTKTTGGDIPGYADIDGDKKADHLLYRANQKKVTIYLSSKSFSPVEFSIGEKDSRLVPSDYDGDGKADLATWSPTSGNWNIAFAKDIIAQSQLNPTGVTQPFVGCGGQAQNTTAPVNCSLVTIKFGKSGCIPIPGDYDGDGKSEIAVYDLFTSKLSLQSLDKTFSKEIDLSKYKNLIPAWFIGV